MSNSNDTNRRRSLLVGLAAGLSLVFVGPADAQPKAEEGGFHPMMRHVLRVGGQEASEASFFITERGDKILVVSPTLPAPVLLGLPTREVQTVAGSELVHRDDGSVDLPADASLTVEGQFAIVDDTPSFKLGGLEVRIEQPPPLLGLRELSELQAFNPDYRWRAAAYEPDEQSLARLEAVKAPVRLRVYFGSWCPHCNRTLPNLMKVVEAMDGSLVRAEYYGLPQDYREGPESAQMDIQSLPLAIVYRGDEEVGRITGQQWASPESTLAELLAGVP